MYRHLPLLVVLFSMGAVASSGVAPKGNSHRALRDGFVQFMPEAKLKPFKDALPHVSDPKLEAILQDPLTMWYDKEALIPVYQDSVTPILGVRANSIGRGLAVDGERVFNNKGQFHFPFATTAGTDNCPNVKVLTFWAPTRVGNRVLPVVWWNDDTTRYRWIFPTGTIFGEVLYIPAPDGRYYPVEVRTRERFVDGWGVNAYRPFPTARQLADAIKAKRPYWESVPLLRAAITHLLDDTTLQPARLTSQYYAKFFTPIDGAQDYIPDLGDEALVKELLTTTVFEPVEGRVWKRHGSLETYAASTQASFHVVPKDYEAGLIAVNDVSCNRCHEDTGRQFGEVSFNSLLYGEIWGEDRIFSWHLFEQNNQIFGAYQKNQKLNPALVSAKLIDRHQSSTHPESLYKALPRRFKIHWY